MPCVVRLDGSDIEVFEHAAEPGEWAVPGGFEFLDDTRSTLASKRLLAFKSGFLGVGSFGRTTLVAIKEIAEDDYQTVVDRLTDHLVDRYGAPDRKAAHDAAVEEVRYAESLCEYDVNTLLAVERDFTDDGISERFKKFIPTDADWEEAKPLVYSTDS
jgi:hypothetical protein